MRTPIRRTPTLVTALVCLGLLCAPSPLRAAAADSADHDDPIEPFNRAMFWFNDKVDVYALEPVAKGWDTIAPNRVQKCLSNFFQNLRFPIVAGNNLLQGKLVRAASDVGRFAVNTTVGVAGFFDPASDWGLDQHDEDFGQTLGYWGVPPGPYLVLPLVGPSNPRDTVGFVGDSFSTVYPFFINFVYTFAARGTYVINTRAVFLRDVRQAKDAAVDYYSFVRNAYEQRRKALVNDRTEMSEQEEEELYEVEPDGGDQP